MVQSTDQPYKPMNGIHDMHPMSASRYRRHSQQQEDDDESNDEKNKAGVLKTQPPGKPAFLTARIQSIKTTYDENPLLSITKPTSAPNNTPVPSPLGSPYLRSSSNIADAAINSATSSPGHAATDATDTLSSSLPQQQAPPPPHPSACPREVLSGKDNGGKQPPRLTRVKSEGYDHVPYIRGDDEQDQEKQKEDNSPISIINRRNIFSTYNSRCCSSSQQVAGPPSTKQESDDAGNQKSGENDGKTHIIRSAFSGGEESSRKGRDDCGMAPQSFYFDKDRSITDPNVRHEQTDEKINISSWLHSKDGAEMYSLIDGSGNENSRNNNNGINRYRDTSSSGNNSKHRDQFSIPDGLISSQPPRSALSIGSAYRGGLNIDSTSEDLSDNNNNNGPHALFPPPPPSSESNDSITGRYSRRKSLVVHREDRSFNENDEAYVPPPPPRYINSKLDDVRTRLLLNPRGMSPKLDEDIGTATAAAVLSNMRSSPYRFSERPQQYNSSRPGSASFSAKGYTRPIVRIHHREHTTTDTDENAILDGDEEEDEGDDDIEEETKKDNYNELKSSSATNRALKAKKNAKAGEDVKKEVTWNKNGKRVNRRLSAPEGKRKKGRKLKLHGQTNEIDSRSASFSRESSLPAAEEDDDGDDNYNLQDLPEEEEDDDDSAAKSGTRGQQRKTTMGSRSRTGCWICRLRKKKCTEERPRCFNCERLNLECFYDVIKPDFVSDFKKKQMKLDEIKTKTKEAKRNAMRKKPSRGNS